MGLAVVAVAILVASGGVACTAFCLVDGDGVRVGRNLDWDLGDGLLVAHPRDADAGRWYASVTCNQFGIDLPLGGMNELGLVVEELSYAPAQPPPAGERPRFDEFRIIQYWLDRYATVDEVIMSLADVAVVRRWFGLHYFLTDRTGQAAVVEFLEGRVVVHRGAGLPVAVLTNDTYARSLAYLGRHDGFGGSRVPTAGPESPERFVRAALALAGGAPASESSARSILANVAQDDTQWAVVHDPRGLTLSVAVAGRPGVLRTDVAAWGDRDLATPQVHDLAGSITADEGWTDWTPAIEARLRDRVRARLGVDPAAEVARMPGPAPSGAGPPSLEIVHVQNAGVQVVACGRTLLFDALLDLRVAPGAPPRLHDHLPDDLRSALAAGEPPFRPADVVLVTHGHDDHHDAATLVDYVNRHGPAAVVHPAGLSIPGLPVSCDRPVSDRGLHTAGRIAVTCLPLRHRGERSGSPPMPHVGYAVHVGPWNVIHVGDAGPSPASVDALAAFDVPGRNVLLVPYWFITDDAGWRWLGEQSLAAEVVVVHAHRGNLAEVAGRVAGWSTVAPRLRLAAERLQRFVFP
jgi:L-ascorbate metabolism protein UlaG (beta-lactamase superfamily)